MAQLIKNMPAMRDIADIKAGFDPWVGKIPWRRKGYPLQYSGLENSMDYIVHEVAESDTTEQLSLSLENTSDLLLQKNSSI